MFRFLELLYHVHLHQPALVGEFVQVFQYSLQHLAPPRLTRPARPHPQPTRHHG